MDEPTENYQLNLQFPSALQSFSVSRLAVQSINKLSLFTVTTHIVLVFGHSRQLFSVKKAPS